jgi:hypothetical protein
MSLIISFLWLAANTSHKDTVSHAEKEGVNTGDPKVTVGGN